MQSKDICRNTPTKQDGSSSNTSTCIQLVISFSLTSSTGYPEFLIVLLSLPTKIPKFCL